ncbi:MAG: T9SS type A sorting domain-containing protein [Bacteroidota bacterium]
MTTAGLSSGSIINKMGWSVSEDYGGGNLLGYTISFAHTTATNSSSHNGATLTTVKNSFNYNPTVTTAGNFDMITLDNNFTWNGTDNILVNVCTNGSNPYTSPYGGVRTIAASTTNGSRYFRCDNSGTCTAICGNNTTDINSNKPQIRFDFTPPPCTGTPNGGNAVLSGIPACSATPFTLTVSNGTLASGVIYQWQSSPDSNSWSPLLITDTFSTYTGVPIYATTYFRRMITCVSTSQPAYSSGIKVLTLYGGTTSSTAPVCGDSITLSLANHSATSSSYQWESSPDSFSWNPVQTTTTSTVKIPSPTSVTFYRAVLSCNFNGATANAIPVKVIPLTGGLTSLTSSVCNDSSIVAVTGASTGAALTFQWESSPDSLNWGPVAGAISASLKVITPATFSYYRRATTCGASVEYSRALKVINPCEGFIYGFSAANNVSYNSIQATGNTFNWRETDGDDNSTFPVLFPAGFNFTYNGVVQPAFYVCTNGWLSFDTTTAYSVAWTNDLTAASPKYIIAPFWEDMVTLTNSFANCSYIKYQLQGTAPNRVMVVEWAEMERYQYGSPSLNFQVKFYEGSNNIEYVYGKMQAYDGSNTGEFSYSVGMTGRVPANGQKLSLLLENTLNFSNSVTNNALPLVPLCNSSSLFTAGGVFNPTNASARPSNDSSGTPVVLTVNATPCVEACGTYYTSKAATPSAMGITPPTTTPDDDVWFKFTAPASGQVSINIFSCSGYNPAFQVMTTTFDSAGLGSAWFRNANTNALEQVTITTLTPFADYLIRIYHAGAGFGSNADPATNSGGFSVCVNEVIPTPLNDNIAGAVTITPGLTCTPVAGTTLGATASPQAVCGGLADDDVWYKFIPSSSVDTITVDGSGTFRAHVEVLSNQLASLSCQNTATNGGDLKITASNLLKDSTYYIRIYHTNAGTASANFTLCITGNNATVPSVTTRPVSNLTVSGGTFSGAVNNNGGFNITRSGVIVSTTPNATIATFGVTDSATNPLVTSGNYSINVTGLTLSTTYYVRAYAINAMGVGYGGDSTFVTPAAAVVPTIQKTAASNITATTVTLGGNIISDGGGTITSSGIVYGQLPNPAAFGNGVVDSTTTPLVISGTYSFNITGLLANTKYYYKAYATNSAGTAYSTQDSFTTAPVINALPYLQNFDAAGITGWTSAITAGTANDWMVGTPAKAVISAAYSAPNAYITKLTGNYSTYHDAAIISPQFDFTGTTADPVLRFKHKFVTESSCCDGGWLEMSINGGAWTKVENTLGTGGNYNTTNATAWYNYTIGAGNSWNGSSNAYASQNNGWIVSSVPLPGALGQPNVKIRFVFHSDQSAEFDGWAIDDIEVFAPSAPFLTTGTHTNVTTSNATLAGNITSDGGRAITASGIVFGTSPAPTRLGSGVIDSATNPLATSGNFTINTTALTGATTYYYRAYAVNSLGTSYGADSVFITPASAVIPTVIMISASAVTGYTAQAGGNITSNGGSPVTASGIVYGTSPNPALLGSGVVDSTTNPMVSAGVFSINMGGLAASTKYYFRAYATNSVGTAYSGTDSFTTGLVVSSMPYNQGFETGNGSWNVQLLAGVNNWILGTPSKTFITGAHSGTQAWATKLTGDYDVNSNSAVVSPQFNMSTLIKDPVLRFYHKFVTENDYDAMTVEISTDGGANWTKLDQNAGTGGNFNTSSSYSWYNNTTTSGNVAPPKFSSNVTGVGSNAIYSSQVSGWIESAAVLTGAAGKSNVKVRFNFSSDGSTNGEGWALDDIQVVSIDSPTVLASNITIIPANTSAALTLTKGSGSRRLIVARLASTTRVAPSNWTLYTANTAFASGSTTGTGNYVVYSDTGRAVTVTGLTQLTAYTFDVYEYDGKYMHVRFGLPANGGATTTPVKLVSFTGVNQDGDGLVSWSTSSEHNNAGFNLERSIDGKTFEYVGFVKGAGNSNSVKQYRYNDANVFANTSSTKVYYRLKQLDHDGKFEYSAVISITSESLSGFDVTAYPVPFFKTATLTILSIHEGPAIITIADVQGRTISDRKVEVTGGSANLVLEELNEVNSGVYFVKVIQNNESKVVRLVKVN